MVDQNDTESDRGWVPFAEPVPDWDTANACWGVWWEIHVYGIASLYITVFIYQVINLILTLRIPKMSRRFYFVTLHIMMMIFAGTRSSFMIIDSYNSKGSLHPSIAYLFLSVGLPCMSSSFYIIFQAYKKVLSMQRARTNQKLWPLLLTVFIHFSFSISLDLAAGFTLHAVYLLITCQGVFIAISYTFSIMYIHLYYRLYKVTVVGRKMMHIISGGDDFVDIRRTDSGRPCGIPKPRVLIGAKFILMAAIFLFILATVYLGGVVLCIVYSEFLREDLHPWLWWGFELGVRLCELILCCTISLAASQPITKQFVDKLESLYKEHSPLKKQEKQVESRNQDHALCESSTRTTEVNDN